MFNVGTLATIVLAGAMGAAAFGKFSNLQVFVVYLSRTAPTRRLTAQWQRRLAVAIILGEGLLAITTVLSLAVDNFLPLLAAAAFVQLSTAFLGVQYIAGGEQQCACFGGAVPDVSSAAASASWTAVLPTPFKQGARNASIVALASIGLLDFGTHVSLLVALAFLPLLTISLFVTAAIIKEHRLLRMPQHHRYAGIAPQLAPLVMLDYHR